LVGKKRRSRGGEKKVSEATGKGVIRGKENLLGPEQGKTAKKRREEWG